MDTVRMRHIPNRAAAYAMSILTFRFNHASLNTKVSKGIPDTGCCCSSVVARDTALFRPRTEDGRVRGAPLDESIVALGGLKQRFVKGRIFEARESKRHGKEYLDDTNGALQSAALRKYEHGPSLLFNIPAVPC
ncbi:hypothetical protein PG984_004177 [Apiospora sp. TS-2023a]